MLKYIIYALIILFALFIVTLLCSAMLWVVLKLLRSLFPGKFHSGKREVDVV